MSGLVGNPFLLASAAGAGGYEISRSLRFNSSDSAYLSRTPSSAGNRRTWTWAGWVKKVKNESILPLYNGRQSSSDFTNLWFDSGDGLFIRSRTGGSDALYAYTSAVFRDPSAWYHVVVAVDTTQATAANGLKVYVNGVQQTLTIPTYSQNSDTWVNSTQQQRIGYLINQNSSTYYLDSYLADIHFIDGQALDPTSFGEFDATTGVWVPKAFTGSYGTNGFRLDFSDNSAATATTLGKDRAGSNNWTPNNLSVTAGAGNDSLVDVPTNGSEVDTGSGGQVRGNYCTWNPLSNFNSSTLSNGNLDVVTAGSAGGGAVFGTFAIPSSGKWYWEIVVTSTTLPSIDIAFAGITKPISGSYQNRSTSAYAEIYFLGGGIGGTVFSSTGTKTNGSSINVGDVCGIAVDRDNGAIYFYKNGVANGSVTGFTFTEGMFPYVEDNSGGSGQSSITANFGQRPFAYTAPSGFKALCTANLPAPVITKPSTAMDVKLYTGNGGTQTISGLGFSPDLVWIKDRSAGIGHAWYDVIRGAGNGLCSNSTTSELVSSAGRDLTGFTSDGFTLGNTEQLGTNTNGNAHVAWTWDAGSSTVTNTQGSITSQVRANTSAGFSVITYTGTGSYATVGHGLNIAPSFLICKSRSNTSDWGVYHRSLGGTKFLKLNTTEAVATNQIYWNNTDPTSTVVSIGQNANENNQNGWTFVMYAFSPVAGYSSFGSYTGNGSTDGPFVYTGFRPRWVMVKLSSSSANWLIWNTAASPYNAANLYLLPNSSLEEQNTGADIDFLSNGFKVRNASTAGNSSSGTILYAAFAESPFQYARAR